MSLFTTPPEVGYQQVIHHNSGGPFPHNAPFPQCRVCLANLAQHKLTGAAVVGAMREVEERRDALIELHRRLGL